MPLNYQDIHQLLSDRNWQGFVGESEGDFLDCKSGIYLLAEENSKAELAKDVSSFANANGGFILVGMRTAPHPSQRVDTIVNVCPFQANLFDSQQHRNIIDEWIYPPIERLRIEWIAEAEDQQTGYGCIQIPPQNEMRKPFLISRTILSGRIRHTIFGYAERKQANSEPLALPEFHQVHRDGLYFQRNLDARLSGIEDRLTTIENRFQGHIPDQVDWADLVSRRLLET